MQFLVERAGEPEGEPCGHALMATCPPEAFPELKPEIPFGHGIGNILPQGQKTWDLKSSDLANLLDLSKRLNLDGEITPVMAWGMVLGHPRFSELTREDFIKMTEDLVTKVRCYGYVHFHLSILPSFARIPHNQPTRTQNKIQLLTSTVSAQFSKNSKSAMH
jgi:hypothetical protein